MAHIMAEFRHSTEKASLHQFANVLRDWLYAATHGFPVGQHREAMCQILQVHLVPRPTYDIDLPSLLEQHERLLLGHETRATFDTAVEEATCHLRTELGKQINTVRNLTKAGRNRLQELQAAKRDLRELQVQHVTFLHQQEGLERQTNDASSAAENLTKVCQENNVSVQTAIKESKKMLQREHHKPLHSDGSADAMQDSIKHGSSKAFQQVHRDSNAGISRHDMLTRLVHDTKGTIDDLCQKIDGHNNERAQEETKIAKLEQDLQLAQQGRKRRQKKSKTQDGELHAAARKVPAAIGLLTTLRYAIDNLPKKIDLLPHAGDPLPNTKHGKDASTSNCRMNLLAWIVRRATASLVSMATWIAKFPKK